MTDILDQFSLLDPALAIKEINAALKGGGGSSSLTVTDGSHTVTGTTQVTVTGAVVGGTSPNATLTVSGGGSSGRTLLTADTTFYVATTGSDTTGDGTSGNPWATPQHANDVICGSIDFNGYDVYIQCADGTYPGVVFGNPVNSGNSAEAIRFGAANSSSFLVLGNSGDNTKVVFTQSSVPGYIFIASSSSVIFNAWYCTEDASTLTADHLINWAQQYASLTLFQMRIVGSTVGGDVFSASQHSLIVATECVVVSGLYDTLVAANDHSRVVFFTSLTVNDATFQVRAFEAIESSVIEINDALTITGTVTGPKFFIDGSSVLDISTISGGSISSLPGSTAGVLEAGGIYKISDTNFSMAGPLVIKSGAAAASDIPVSTFALFKNTSGGGVVLGYNDGGVLKTVALT